MIEQSHDERVYQQHRDMTQKKKIFRKAIKSLAIRMTDHNLSL